MQSRMARRQFALVLAGALVAAGAAGRAQAVDVTGEWVFAVETGMGSGTPTLTFKQSGEAITGTYNGQLGNTNFTGTVKGADIAFSFTVDAQGQSVDVSYTGTVDGATMKGAVSMAGGQLSGTFTGKKK